jgi:hypothetical protein
VEKLLGAGLVVGVIIGNQLVSVYRHKITPPLKAAAKMPPLNHWPNQDFDIMQSEVAEWLCQQPEIRQEVFNWCKLRGAITYDLHEKRWRGIAWQESID